MVTTIINIGNSKGIILPKSILKQCEIDDQVNIKVQDKTIVITAAIPLIKRKEWGKVFKKMAKNGDDELVIPDVINNENTDE